MLKHFALLATALMLVNQTALSQTVLVNETFDGYANQAAMEAVWPGFDGTGVAPVGTVGTLVPAATSPNLPEPANNPPGLMGQGAAGNPNGSINQYGTPFSVPAAPTATESLVLSGDIFLPGNYTSSRQTIGLRTKDIDPLAFGAQVGNLLEMGTWNATTCDPTVEGCDTGSPGSQTPETPGFQASTQFGYRLAIFQFGSYGDMTVNGENRGPILVPPNWQYFELDPAFDLEENGGNGDDVVTIVDIGDGWHTYTATISLTDITLELDLFRNGINDITGLPGADSTVNIQVELIEDPNNPGQKLPFDSLRFGGPSGSSSLTTTNDPLPAVFDNISLALVEPSQGTPGDYNGDGFVNLADYTVWRDNLGGDGSALLNRDSANVGPVGAGDYASWKANFGGNAAAQIGRATAAVPEPSSLMLVAITAGLIGGWRRCR